MYRVGRLTIIQCGNPGLNGMIPSRYLICSSEREILRASILAVKCSTLRPPMIGKTYGVFCMTYAMATAGIPRSTSRPTSLATFSRACETFFSSSDLSQGPKVVRPFSPVCLRLSSSASDRSLPAARTCQGASARPVENNQHSAKVVS